MKVDVYTKIVLTVIALALTFNLMKPVLSPSDAQAGSSGKLGHVQMGTTTRGVVFFDTRTGDLWVHTGWEDPPYRMTLLELGKPMKFHK